MQTDKRSYDTAAVDAILRGAYDTHIHSAPDVVPRRCDALELAQDAAAAGMGGIVLKCHVAPTEGQAYVVQRVVPEVRVFGGLALNSHCGGFNPAAVELSIRLGARITWMPTVYAANQLRHQTAGSHLAAIGGGVATEGVTVYDEAGRLRPELVEILRLMAENDVVLATGHISPQESVDLIEEAQRQGVRRIVVTHPELQMTRMSWEDQDDLAAKGVFFERCWVVTTPAVGEGQQVSPHEIVAVIRRIGPESTIMATDHGQAGNPRPVDGMRAYVAALLEAGISTQDLELMAKRNAAQLLGC